MEGLAWAGAPPAAAVLTVVVLGLNNLRSEAVLGVLVLFAPPVLQTDAARYGLLFVGFAVATQGRNAMSCRPLGYQLLLRRDGSVGFGMNGKPDFWIHANRPLSGPLHVAFASADRPTVQAVHAAGLEAGGRDNGAPGLRPQYHNDYFGAFVLDPDGNNLEAVCPRPA